MKIQNKDFYHGAALTKIVEHPSFKALNKADSKYGHYQVNHDRRLLVKHAENAASPWQFTFQYDDLDTLKSDMKSGIKTMVVLVCGKTTICILRKPQVMAIIDLDATSQQWIRVKIPKAGASMRVSGTDGELKHVIAHSDFPQRVFG